MASETQTSARVATTTIHWRDAIVAGLVAGVVMGLMLQFVMGMMEMIGALYGMPTVGAGWAVHLLNSIVFALLFAVAVTRAPFDRYAASIGGSAVLGAAYGVVIWIVAASFVMPLWVRALDLGAPAVPTFDPMSLVGHLVYGILIGVAYAVLARR